MAHGGRQGVDHGPRRVRVPGVEVAGAVRTIETDVVVIGGGSAGCYAALKVHSEGLRVLQTVKGFLGRSGASIFAGNLQLQKTKDPAEEEKFIAVRALRQQLSERPGLHPARVPLHRGRVLPGDGAARPLYRTRRERRARHERR